MTGQVAGTGVAGRRTNRRGHATRESMLEAALKSLASGEPGSVSANRIAKEIGATWGAVQYQFGDTDGFWAAVLHRTAERRAATFSTLSTPVEPDAPLRERVGAIIETLYRGLASADSRAIENLRAALPRDPHELERLYPRTAAELFSWGKSWLRARLYRAGISLRLVRSPAAPKITMAHAPAGCAIWPPGPLVVLSSAITVTSRAHHMRSAANCQP